MSLIYPAFTNHCGSVNHVWKTVGKVCDWPFDCAVSIDADLQQDEWAIEKFVAEYMNGADIVSGIRNDRKTDSLFKKVTALMFYKTMNILGAIIRITDW